MPTRDVPRVSWEDFLDGFSRQHRAWLTRVEQRRPDGHVEAATAERPLEEVTPERREGDVAAIRVGFGEPGTRDAAVVIDAPVAVRLEQTPDGADCGLEIEDAAGRRTRLKFRAAARPDLLDGIAPGEL